MSLKRLYPPGLTIKSSYGPESLLSSDPIMNVLVRTTPYP